MFRFFLVPLRQCRRKIGTLLFSLLVVTLAQSVFLLLAGPVLNALFSQEQEILRISLRFLPDWQFSRSVFLVWLPVFISVTGIIKAIGSYFYRRSQSYISLWMAKYLRQELFAAVLAQPYSVFQRKSSAQWMSIIMNNTFLLQTRFSDIMTCLIKNSAQIIGCVVVLALIHFPSAVILVILALVIAFLLRALSRSIAWFARDYQEKLEAVTAKLLDIRKRFEFIKSQEGEQLESDDFSRHNQNYYRSIRRSIFIRSGLSPGSEFVGIIIFALVLLLINYQLWLVASPQVMIIQFLIALGFILKPVKNFSDQVSNLQETKGALISCMKILEKNKKRIREIKSEKKIKKDFTIANLSVSYAKNEKIIFARLPIVFGRITALIGDSGAGKTTLAKVLAGLIRPDGWQCEHTQAEIGANVSYASQNPFLFQDTIAANLGYGLPEGELPLDRYLKIFELQKKITTEFDPLAPELSGGQVQKLTVIRTLLRPASIIVLDEIAAAIDMEMEKKIILILKGIAHRENKFVLVITHRQQLLPTFDQVWYKAGGNAQLLCGTHSELWAGHESYRQFCQTSHDHP